MVRLTYASKKMNIFDFQLDFMPGRSGTTPGQEITPGIRIRAWEALKSIKNDEKMRNLEFDEISHEMHCLVNF